MKLKKRDVQRIREILDEMTELLDEIRTPVLKEPEPEKWIGKLLLDLRAHYSTNCGRQPTHVNLDPERHAALLMELPPVFSLSGDTVFGMKVCDEPERAPFDMWEHREIGPEMIRAFRDVDKEGR